MPMRPTAEGRERKACSDEEAKADHDDHFPSLGPYSLFPAWNTLEKLMGRLPTPRCFLSVNPRLNKSSL